MPEILLRRPDDSGEYDSTLVRFVDENSYETVTLYPTHYRNATNPMIEAIKVWLIGKLRVSRRSLYRNTWKQTQRGYYLSLIHI